MPSTVEGNVADVAIFPRLLTPGEIAALHQLA